MAIKLIALDIDGTLTGNAENTVSERNREAIRRAQAQGVYVTIATGRACFAARPFWRTLGIEGASIQYGGALTVDTRTDEVLESVTLAPMLVRDLMRFAWENGIPAHLYQNDIIYTACENPYSRAYVQKNGMTLVVDPSVTTRLFDDVPKVLAFAEQSKEPELHARFAERFGGVAHVTRSQLTFVEINDFCATKGKALMRLAKRLGVTREEVAAVGDSFLDIDMLEWAGTGVCVADGVEEAKRAADVIAPPSAEDGVADFIERYVLQ